MSTAYSLFGLAATLAAAALIAWVLGHTWLRAREQDLTRRSDAESPLWASLQAQLSRIEQAVEATSLEVERLGEAQRFTDRLLAEHKSAAGALERPAVPPREVR